MSPLELSVLRTLGLPEDASLLRTARLHQPRRAGAGHPLFKALRWELQTAGALVEVGVCHTLRLEQDPSGWTSSVARWVDEQVLPSRQPRFTACSVSVRSLTARELSVVVLLAQMAGAR